MSRPSQKIRVQFALRAVDREAYWDGYSRRQLRYGKMASWTPKLLAKPTFWSTQKRAVLQWKKYELERLCGEPIPELEIVRYEMKAVEMGSIPAKVSFEDVVYERIKRSEGADFSQAFQKMAVKCGLDPKRIQEYRFAFKRRGAAKAILEEQLPEAVSHGFVSIVKSEKDLVYARMLLGAQLVEHWEMAPYYDTETPIK